MILSGVGNSDKTWQEQLAIIVDTMREISRHTDPQAVVRAYASRIGNILQTHRTLALSRRDLEPPWYRITRSTTWSGEVNPWKDKDRLPLLRGGLLGELIYGEEPRIIDDLQVSAGDPAAEYFAGQRSLIAIPHFLEGQARNMVVHMRTEAGAFDREQFPEWVWLSNLFGRATHNLVLAQELKKAYNAVDQEMKVVADIQMSLLPPELPKIPTMDLAVHYQTSQRAGGDYYDFFPLPGGRWGMLIADVSGHGTPAAVLMAVTHTIAHTHPGPPTPPGRLLSHVNHHLAARYTGNSGTFVTAFYGIYDPATRSLTYACAGHNPPRVKRCSDGSLLSLNGAQGLPLGIADGVKYEEGFQQLQVGDQVVLYTDGITEAHNPAGEMFGVERLDGVVGVCPLYAEELLKVVLTALDDFTAGLPAADDRTLLVAKIT
jgi:sigma-B regulation protein RsbU (phosphoserine phosphatase)